MSHSLQNEKFVSIMSKRNISSDLKLHISSVEQLSMFYIYHKEKGYFESQSDC